VKRVRRGAEVGARLAAQTLLLPTELLACPNPPLDLQRSGPVARQAAAGVTAGWVGAGNALGGFSVSLSELPPAVGLDGLDIAWEPDKPGGEIVAQWRLEIAFDPISPRSRLRTRFRRAWPRSRKGRDPVPRQWKPPVQKLVQHLVEAGNLKHNRTEGLSRGVCFR
jgi:hypothetical protein